MPGAGHGTGLTTLTEYLLSLTQGGVDGAIRGYLNDGDTVAQSGPTMRVEVKTFVGYCSSKIAYLATQTATDLLTAPTGGSATDLRQVALIQWTVGTGVNVKTGSELTGLTGTIATDIAAGKVPAMDSDSFIFAYIYMRNGMATILNGSDATEGWIVMNDVDIGAYLGRFI